MSVLFLPAQANNICILIYRANWHFRFRFELFVQRTSAPASAYTGSSSAENIMFELRVIREKIHKHVCEHASQEM